MIHVVDARKFMPKHQNRFWKRRSLNSIKGFIVHQSASDRMSLMDIADYHIRPTKDRNDNGIIDSFERNHISSKGCPGICYTYGIENDASIYLLNDLRDITWHASGYNSNYLGIVVNCNAQGPTWKGTEESTDKQIESLEVLLRSLKTTFVDAEILGHGEVNSLKENCPGNKIMDFLDQFRKRVF